MCKRNILIFCICVYTLLAKFTFGQESYPQNDFISPVPIPISLSGNFSELRTGHFHAGLDFRTGGQVGVPVLAIADGVVSRISISASGYGKMLFIQHDNGYTSGFAHLSAFEPQLAEFVKQMQYQEESFEVNLNPPVKTFRYQQGDTIAFSGNSGHSTAPHLHFEIRETESEWLVNPLLFGYNLKDQIKPTLQYMRLYPLDDFSAIQVVYYGKSGTYKRNYFKAVTLRLLKSNGRYVLSGVKEIRAKGKLGLAIVCKDQINGSSSTLDIYKMDLEINGKTIYSQQRDFFSLDHTRYINAHLDYSAKVVLHKNYQRLFVLPNNKLSFYKQLENNGVIDLKYGDSLDVQVTASDFFKNSVSLTFQLRYFEFADSLIPQKHDTGYKKIFYFNQPNVFITSDIELNFPEYSFYEDIRFHYQKKKGWDQMYSDIHSIHDDKVAVQHYYTIQIKAIDLPETYQSKAYVAQIGKNKTYWFVGGTYENGYVVSKCRGFGDFAIMVDTVAPTIKSLNFWNNSNLTGENDIRLSIYDRLSGIKSYRGSIDNKWVLMEYDKKKKLLVHKFEDVPDGREHIFKIIVTDKKENEKELKIKFKR
ncbi:MAG: M23 family metallopeptidase [Bacteroidetes bacterium]|nr:M23 family metallopeptidase [Bacteroidota bacterium]